MRLIIGNKNYSSWSMRPWVLMTQAGIPFSESLVRFDFHEPDSRFAAEVARYSPTACVPVLVEDDGWATWDSLAIAERLHELYPQAGVWPATPHQRAHARALAATMHSGLSTLRRLCPMNINTDLRAVGPRLLAHEPGLRADLQRLEALWEPALQASSGPMLFGTFCAADAFFAPVALRVRGYGLSLGPLGQDYVDRLCATPAVQRWVTDARQEPWFVPEDEPYRSGPGSAPA